MTYIFDIFFQLKNVKKDSVFSWNVTAENIAKFSWGTALADAREDLPCTVECLEATLPKTSLMVTSTVRGCKGQKR
jgi:hypothetical protein